MEISLAVSLAWRIAASEALKGRHPYVEKEHVVLGILSLEKTFATPPALLERRTFLMQSLLVEWRALKALLEGFGLDERQLRRRIRAMLGKGAFEHAGSAVHRSAECKGIFSRAGDLSSGNPEVSCLHLLAAIAETPGDIIGAVLAEAGVNPGDLHQRSLASARESAESVSLSLENAFDLPSVQDFAEERGYSILTVVFDDIVGSTALLHGIGDKAFAELLREHDSVLGRIVGKDGAGKVLKSTGDGLLMVFTSSSAAVERAVEIQKAFQGHEYLKLRVGMDMGQVTLKDDHRGLDVLGLRVAMAYRLASLAEAGQILTSEAVYEQASNTLPADLVSWRSLGSRVCKPGEPVIDVYEATGSGPVGLGSSGDGAVP